MKIRNILIASAIFVSLCSGKAMAATNNTVNGVNSLETIGSITSTKIFPEKRDVAVDKKWTIKFSKEISANVVNKDNFQVLDSNGQALQVQVSRGSDGKTVNILPPQQKYKNGQTYSLVIKSSTGLKSENRMSFTTINSASNSSGGGSSSGSTTNNVDPSLIEAKDGLAKVQDIVKTQAEKDFVSVLRTAVDAKINNPSVKVDTTSIKAKYNSLSDSEKDDFKSVILNNFSIGTLLKIRSLFQ